MLSSRSLALVLLLLSACVIEGGPPVPSSADAGVADANPRVPEAGLDAGAEGCDGPGPGCVCAEEGASCTHSLGGIYGDQACSASYQCCDGAFTRGTGVCGPCACTEATGETGCAGNFDTMCFPSFESEIVVLPQEVIDEMVGTSWHAELACPPLASLRLVRVSHWTFDGVIATGELVLAATVAADMVALFDKLYREQFPIERIERIDLYDGDDDASLAANNTSAFNCRAVTGGSSLSQHSFGTAIDINPRQNPYVSGQTVLPPDGALFLDRADRRPGMIVSGDVVVTSFGEVGWGWGGNFNSLKDYQHFSLSGS